MSAQDRLFSLRTFIQGSTLVVVAALIGIGFNSIRGNSEAKVELSRQYHPADVMKLQNNGASATEALNRESAEQSGVDT